MNVKVLTDLRRGGTPRNPLTRKLLSKRATWKFSEVALNIWNSVLPSSPYFASPPFPLFSLYSSPMRPSNLTLGNTRYRALTLVSPFYSVPIDGLFRGSTNEQARHEDKIFSIGLIDSASHRVIFRNYCSVIVSSFVWYLFNNIIILKN